MLRSPTWKGGVSVVLAVMLAQAADAQLGSGMSAAPPKKTVVVEVQANGKTTALTLKAVHRYRYAFGSLRPNRIHRSSMGMGMDGMEDGGMGMDMGMSMGEEGMGGMGGMGPMGPGGGSPPADSLELLVFEPAQASLADARKLAALQGGAVEPGESDSNESNGSDDQAQWLRAAREPLIVVAIPFAQYTRTRHERTVGMAMGMGMEMEDMAGGYDDAIGMGLSQPRFELLSGYAGREVGKDGNVPRIASPQELQIVGALICNEIWKERLVQLIRKQSQSSSFLAKAEPVLQKVLASQYDSHLARQRFEIDRIERKVQRLKSEVSRRESAKDRVVEIQSGRIVLESQGLLPAEIGR